MHFFHLKNHKEKMELWKLFPKFNFFFADNIRMSYQDFYQTFFNLFMGNISRNSV